VLRSSLEDEQGIDDMRRILEASWNVETMGSVPTNADSAAEAAATAIINASGRKKEPSDGHSNLFFVDLLLPQYDIRQGSNLYDEVLAVDFCVSLSKRLEGRSIILVRDDKTVRTVARVLEARERDRIVSSDLNDGDSHEDDDDDEEEEEDVELYSDFETDIGDVSDDVESFRNQLMSGWKKEIPMESSQISRRTSMEVATSTARYRLASMLGSATISSGADMVDDVIRAVSANAQPKDDEETMIILSATSREEMIGVRGLVSKYGGNKTVLLVNCNLIPPPRELFKAQTVYSIQPFIARQKVSEGNIFGSSAPSSSVEPQATLQPKVVLIRRFPRDWEVFVDVGGGFELARTVPATQVDTRGPSMEFIASCVKEFLQSRLG
jgi:Domain of unknown function (DUF1995)